MVTPRQKFSSQADPDLLAAMRQIARNDGRHFQAVLEDAMSHYIESRAQAEGPPRSDGALPGERRATPPPL